MKRLSTSLSLLSLLLCAGINILWFRSYSRSDYISRNNPTSAEPRAVTSQQYEITFIRGDVRLSSKVHTYFSHITTIPAQSVDQSAHWDYGSVDMGGRTPPPAPSGIDWAFTAMKADS